MKQWKILIAHNFYIQPGGEDVVFKAEAELLREQGHQVLEYTDTNTCIEHENPVSVALQTIWSWKTYAKFYSLLSNEHPDVVHFHNTFPLISPSAYYACEKFGIPVVQTLHNYRLFCPAATFYREGTICEECIKKPFLLPAIKYKCFQKSRLKTAVLTTSLNLHKIINTWQNRVSTYIALTQFSKNKFVEAGLPPEKIAVKPNFVKNGYKTSIETNERFFMCVGRLSHEKGITTLLKAWQYVNIPLFIFGDGPLRPLLETAGVNIHFLGQVDRAELFASMQRAYLLVFPSEWYEGFPMTIVEAFSVGLPVLTSDIGSQAEIVRDGFSGLHFHTGDPKDLALKSNWLWNHPKECLQMGQNARREYEEKYTSERNYQMLMEIYEKAITNHR